MRKSRFTEEQIIGVLHEHEAGMHMADLCRKHAISPATVYQWKAKFGGLEVSEARRLRSLEAENARLKKLLAEAMLDNAVLKDVASKSGDARSTEERCDLDARRARDQRAAGVCTPRRGPQHGSVSITQAG